jgi:AcrR family transcriptional regulator
MARRTKVDAEKTRAALLRDATALFEAKGYSDTSIADICESCGVTKGALFHHFKSKQALFTEVWTSLQTEMDNEARVAATAARSLTDHYAALLAGCRTYLKWASRHDYQQIVLIDGPSVLGQAGWYERDSDLGQQNVGAGMRYLAKKGIIAQHRVPALSIMVQSALNGSGFALSRHAEGITQDSVMDAFEAFVKALR